MKEFSERFECYQIID
jgi:transcription antitermination factor NusA-like protein